MRPQYVTLTISVDRDGIAAAQTTAGAGNLTLNGALISGGVWSSTTAQKISFYCAGNISALTFTINGKGYDSNGFKNESMTETVTGPNATTVATSKHWYYISSITVDGAVGTNVEVGTYGAAVSQIFPVNRFTKFATGLQTVVGGTATYSTQFTVMDVFDTTATLTWADAADMSAATASATSAIDAEVMGVRFVISSANNAATLTGAILCR